jgi:hypothetical protein
MLKMLNALTTEFYISDTGYLCIKQYDYPEEPSAIVLSREQALMLKDHFDVLLKEQDEKWDGLDHSADIS